MKCESECTADVGQTPTAQLSLVESIDIRTSSSPDGPDSGQRSGSTRFSGGASVVVPEPSSAKLIGVALVFAGVCTSDLSSICRG